MTLRARLALTLALLAAVTAIAVVSVGYRVTSGRLNQAIDSSLSDFSLRLASEPFVAQRICGVFIPPPGVGIPDDNHPDDNRGADGAVVALIAQHTAVEPGRRGRQRCRGDGGERRRGGVGWQRGDARLGWLGRR